MSQFANPYFTPDHQIQFIRVPPYPLPPGRRVHCGSFVWITCVVLPGPRSRSFRIHVIFEETGQAFIRSANPGLLRLTYSGAALEILLRKSAAAACLIYQFAANVAIRTCRIADTLD